MEYMEHDQTLDVMSGMSYMSLLLDRTTEPYMDTRECPATTTGMPSNDQDGSALDVDPAGTTVVQQ